MRDKEKKFHGPDLDRDPDPWADACGGAWSDACAGRRRHRSCCDFCWLRSNCPYADGRVFRD